MNKVEKSFYVVSMLLMAACHQPATAPAIPSDAGVEEKVEQVLARMTLEEKIGQMTQLSVDVLGKFENDDFVLDDAKLQEAIGQYKVGSILNKSGSGGAELCQMAGDNRQDSNFIHEGDWYSLYLWLGPKPWNNVYAGGYIVPAEYQSSCFV